MNPESAGTFVRPAVAKDFEAIAAIYRPIVIDTAISFETEPPDTAEMRQRWQRLVAVGAPYLVAEDAGKVLGYAHVRPFHERAAYAWTVENSIFVAAHAQRRGVGRKLLGALIAAAAGAGFRQMVALIAADAAAGSLELHRAHGFTFAGRLTSVGHKHGRWHDVVYLQRALGEGDVSAPGRIAAARR